MSRPTKEVTARYHAKTYNRYYITLRKDSDAELISRIENNKTHGIPPTETIRRLYKEGKSE